jgi:tRNA threonylcarbamoyladenosine biosynthesis protein TsaB
VTGTSGGIFILSIGGQAQYSRPMYVLAIDTSTSACSAALLDGDAVVAHRLLVMARGQSEALMPMIRAVMAEAAIGFDRLDLLAVTVGPGAFTGLRIGLAAARGLALATGLPLAGVTTTRAVAQAVPIAERAGHTLAVAIESRRDRPWVQMFDADLVPLSDIAARSADEVRALCPGPLRLVGDGAAGLIAGLPDAVPGTAPGWPDARWVGRVGVDLWRRGVALPPQPLYLREADVTVARAAP